MYFSDSASVISVVHISLPLDQKCSFYLYGLYQSGLQVVVQVFNNSYSPVGQGFRSCQSMRQDVTAVPVWCQSPHNHRKQLFCILSWNPKVLNLVQECLTSRVDELASENEDNQAKRKASFCHVLSGGLLPKDVRIQGGPSHLR